MTYKPPDEAEFREICRREFQYLLTDYGFKELPASGDPWGFMVRFESPATLITVVGRSFGYWTDVYVDRAGASSEPDYDVFNGCDVRKLLATRKARLPLASPFWFGLPALLLSWIPWKPLRIQNDQRLQIPVYAKALREAAQDVLRGDLTVLATRPQSKAGSPTPVLRMFGIGLVLLGLVLPALDLGLGTYAEMLLTRPSLELLTGAPAVIAGAILIAVDVYQARTRTSA